MNRPFRRYALRGAAVAALAALAASAGGGLRRFLANRRENGRLERKVSEAEAVLERKRALLGIAQKNDELLESEARRQLGLIGAGEIEFRFVPAKDGGPERLESSDPSPS